MVAPTTYSEWAYMLDKFGNGDDAVLEYLSKGSFILDAGTATRFYLRVEEVYKMRKKYWLDKFQRSFQLNNFKNEDDFTLVLRNGKQNLAKLNQFVCLDGLPDDLRKLLKKDLEKFVTEIKNTLKSNVARTSHGRERMLFVINTFGIIDYPDQVKTDNENTKSYPNEIIPTTGRKIVF